MFGFLHFNELEKDLLILLSIVGAQKINNRHFNRRRVRNCLPHALWPTEEGLVEEKIISTAVQLRMIEDKFNSKKVAVRYPYIGEEVFSLVRGTLSRSDKSKSSLRVVCDKIIHADKISIYEGLDKKIKICGKRGSQLWEIGVNLINYSLNGLCLITQYHNNGDVGSRGVIETVKS